MTILFLGQIERELIIDSEIVVARTLARITMIVIGTIAFFTVVTSQTFCATIAFCCFRMTMRGLTYSTGNKQYVRLIVVMKIIQSHLM